MRTPNTSSVSSVSPVKSGTGNTVPGRLWGHTCTWYTVFSLLLLLVQFALQDSRDGFVILPHRYLLIFPFALCMGALELLPMTKLSRPLCLVCHYCVFLIAFFLCLVLPATGVKNSTRFLIVLSAAVLYWIVRLTVRGVLRLFPSAESKETQYQNLYR